MDLKVRNIDDTTAARLKQIAKEKIRYTEDKYAELLEKMTELYRASMEEAAECIRENNYLMAKLLKENEKDE